MYSLILKVVERACWCKEQHAYALRTAVYETRTLAQLELEPFTRLCNAFHSVSELSLALNILSFKVSEKSSS